MNLNFAWFVPGSADRGNVLALPGTRSNSEITKIEGQRGLSAELADERLSLSSLSRLDRTTALYLADLATLYGHTIYREL